MKPETQYRLLVKVASADRATRVLAIGAMNLRKNASPESEKARGDAFMEGRRKAKTGENLQEGYFNRVKEVGADQANKEYFGPGGIAETQQKQIATAEGNTAGLQHINEVSAKYPSLTNFQVPIGEEAAAATAVDNKLKSNRNWGIGAGIGGGALLAGGTYGALGLIPALKRRRLARLIAALGVGGVGGTALGMATQEGLNTGAIQGMYNKVRSKIG